MPSVYSGNYQTGTYTYTRVRVDYSGTSATAHLLYTRTNAWYDPTSAYGATFTFGGASVGFDKSFSGPMTDAEVASVSFTISTSGGTYSGSTSGAGLLGFSGSVNIPAQGNQYPDGLSFTPTEITPESVTGTIAVSNWNGGSASTREKAINVCTSNNANNRRYALATGSQLSDTLTVDNNSALIGSCTITGNTRYYFLPWATNGNQPTPNVWTQFVTPPYAPTITLDSVEGVKASFSYSLQADGGYYEKDLMYSLDGGNTWKQVAHVSSGVATSGTFDITQLSTHSTVTVITKVQAESLEAVGPSFTITTTDAESDKIFGSVNGRTKRAGLLYGSVNSQSAFIVKLYGPEQVSTLTYTVTDIANNTGFDSTTFMSKYNTEYGDLTKEPATLLVGEIPAGSGSMKAFLYDSNNTMIHLLFDWTKYSYNDEGLVWGFASEPASGTVTSTSTTQTSYQTKRIF